MQTLHALARAEVKNLPHAKGIHPSLSVAKEKKNSFSHRCTQMYTDKNRWKYDTSSPAGIKFICEAWAWNMNCRFITIPVSEYISIRPYPQLSVAKEKKNSFSHRCTQMYTNKRWHSNRVLHCDNPSMESTLHALVRAEAKFYSVPSAISASRTNEESGRENEKKSFSHM